MLKAAKQGKRNIYVSSAKLIHKESVSRSLSHEGFERDYMLAEWSKELTYDTFYNQNLEKHHTYKTATIGLAQLLTGAQFQKLLKEKIDMNKKIKSKETKNFFHALLFGKSYEYFVQ